MEADFVPIRAHHGMCLTFFRGKGYSDAFTAHMAEVQQKLMENPQVRIVDGLDEICRVCPNRDGDCCITQEEVREYDHHVFRLCGLEPDCIMPYKEFHRLVAERILLAGKREAICGNCEWNELCKP